MAVKDWKLKVIKNEKGNYLLVSESDPETFSPRGPFFTEKEAWDYARAWGLDNFPAERHSPNTVRRP